MNWKAPSTVHFRILHYLLVSKKVQMKILTTVNCVVIVLYTVK